MPSQELEYLSRYLPFVTGDGATTPDLFKLTNTAFSKAGIAEAADEEEWKQDFADIATKVRSMEDFSEDDSEDDGRPGSEPARGRSRDWTDTDQMYRLDKLGIRQDQVHGAYQAESPGRSFRRRHEELGRGNCTGVSRE